MRLAQENLIYLYPVIPRLLLSVPGHTVVGERRPGAEPNDRVPAVGLGKPPGTVAGRHDTCLEYVMKRKFATFLSAAAVVAVTAPAIAGGVDPIRVEARMSAGNDQSQARARYQDRARRNTLEQRFDVEVEDFAPGTELNVSVNGMSVGTIFVNALGTGELQLRTAAFIDDPGDGDPIDTDFPRLQPGDTVSVGPLKGAFVER